MASMNEAKVGYASLSDDKSAPEKLQLQLTGEVLILLKEEYVHQHPDISENGNDESILDTVRTVDVYREDEGGLGLSIKGGSEHKLPALISRIIPGQAAAKTESLYIGDAIIEVNGQNVESMTHDSVIETLRTAGDIVSLTVKHFKPAAIFLNKTNNAGATNNNNERKLSPPGVVLPHFDKQWVVYSSIPLLYAYLTRYHNGTDQLRTNSFELVGIDGTSSGILQFEDSHSLAEWVAAVTNNILQLLSQLVKMMNRLLLPEEQILYMGWAQERVTPGRHSQPWKPKFVALKGPDIYLFDFPPMQTRDWVHCDTVFRVYECMFKLMKDSELLDDKQHCCSVQTGSKETIYLSLESRSDVLQLEKAWYRANHLSVIKLKSRTFGCTYKGRLSGLTLDMDVGFSLYDSQTKSFQWSYKFSRLKGSSDDGKQKLKLHFQSDTPNQTETQEIECSGLHTLLFCIHSFLSVKLASVDPSFLTNY